MRYLNLYDIISRLNCLAWKAPARWKIGCGWNADVGVSIERGVNEYLPGSYYLRPWRREVRIPDTRLQIKNPKILEINSTKCLSVLRAEMLGGKGIL